MPQVRQQEHMLEAVWPITADEVVGMFKQATNRPPWPDVETCGHLATWLSAQTIEGARRRFESFGLLHHRMSDADETYRVRFHDAVDVLRQTAGHEGSFPEALGHPWDQALAQLVSALDRVETMAPPEVDQNPSMKRWAPTAISINFTVADTLIEFGRRGGTSKNSVATRFTMAAMTRIGWRDAHGRPITAAAIEGYCAKPDLTNKT